MRIYDYLFYKTYILAKQSRNFDDVPILGGIVFVIGCIMMNIFTIVLFLMGLGININTGIVLDGWHKYPFSIALLALIYFYYSYKGRYKKIIKRYEAKASAGKQISPFIVALIYIAVSFGLLLLAGLFKNKDWIFTP